jgi:tetratricopeptide (TPR) repeat protein
MKAHLFAAGARTAWLLAGLATAAAGQERPESSPQASPGKLLETLPLDSAARATLEQAIDKHDYGPAEDLLAERATKNPKSQPFLLALADVLFLDGKQLNCAVVLKKAEQLGPLDERNRFLLALSYVTIGQKSLASRELERLEQLNASNALYPYWLSRLAYRKMDLQLALIYAEKAVSLDPAFMKGYDQLGLCYAGLNLAEQAIQAYTKAILLNRQQSLRSPWPSMNLGTLFRRLDRLEEAESHLRDSVGIDPRFPAAHLRLGQVLEKRERFEEAATELKEAARLDPTYPEPHYTLARIYMKRKDRESANRELNLFQELRNTDNLKGITRPD